MLGLVKPISVGICGDAKAAARALIGRLSGRALACHGNREQRRAEIAAERSAWESELEQWSHEKDRWSLEVAKGSSAMHPRQMLRELEKAMPDDDGLDRHRQHRSVSNSYLRFKSPRSMFAAMSFGNCGYASDDHGAKVAAPGRPAVPMSATAPGKGLRRDQTCVREGIPVTTSFSITASGAPKRRITSTSMPTGSSA
jgi:sulfoacetaldehyde acetyltransferase